MPKSLIAVTICLLVAAAIVSAVYAAAPPTTCDHDCRNVYHFYNFATGQVVIRDQPSCHDCIAGRCVNEGEIDPAVRCLPFTGDVKRVSVAGFALCGRPEDLPLYTHGHPTAAIPMFPAPDPIGYTKCALTASDEEVLP